MKVLGSGMLPENSVCEKSKPGFCRMIKIYIIRTNRSSHRNMIFSTWLQSLSIPSHIYELWTSSFHFYPLNEEDFNTKANYQNDDNHNSNS